MKNLKFYFALILACYFSLQLSLAAQDVFAYKFIGKPRANVIERYGKPIHMDNSDPSMVCMFYKKGNDQMVFVSDQSSVFQVDASQCFTNKTSALDKLSNLLAEASKDDFITDTLSVSEYQLKKAGIEFNAVVMHNDNMSRYEVRVKASRR